MIRYTTGREAVRDIDALLSGLMGIAQGGRLAGAPSLNAPKELPVNLYETDELYLIEAEIPGVKESEIEITAKGDEVVLSIKPEREEVNEGVTVHRRERVQRQRTRLFRFATEIESERVEALLKNGVLTVRLPKHASARAKKIQVVTH